MSFRGKLIHLIEEKLEEPTDEYFEDVEENEEENADNKSTGQVSVAKTDADDQTNQTHVRSFLFWLIYFLFFSLSKRKISDS